MAEGPHYGAQTKARKLALDILFAADQRGVGPLEVMADFRADDDITFRDLTVTLVHGVVDNLHSIDSRIQDNLTGRWSLDRMPSVDRCLARIAVFEIDHTDLADATAISEAVRLAGDLSTDASPRFLNGVLKGVSSTPHSHD